MAEGTWDLLGIDPHAPKARVPEGRIRMVAEVVWEASAVAEAAMRTGVAQEPVNIEDYRPISPNLLPDSLHVTETISGRRCNYESKLSMGRLPSGMMARTISLSARCCAVTSFKSGF